MLFKFNGQDVRTVKHEGEAWFVASDLCEILDIGRVHDAVRGLDDDEKGADTIRTPGGDQQVTVVSESGVYALIFKSRKPVAKRFRKWVTSEVLPALRKKGVYDRFDPANQTDLLQEAESLLNKVASVQNKAGERDGIYSYHKDNGWTRSEMGKMAKRELGLKGTLKDFNKLLMILGITVAKDKNKFELAPEYYWMADDALTYNRSLRSRMPNGNPHFNAAGKEGIFEMILNLKEERADELI